MHLEINRRIKRGDRSTTLPQRYCSTQHQDDQWKEEKNINEKEFTMARTRRQKRKEEKKNPMSQSEAEREKH